MCCWVNPHFGFPSIALIVPCGLWTNGGPVTHVTTPKTWARNASAWAMVLTPTLVTRFSLSQLGGLLSFVLFHPKFKPPNVSVFLIIGSSRAELFRCLAFFSIFNLGLIDDAGYFHSLLIHFLKVGISVPSHYLLHFPSYSLPEVLHPHFFSGHLIWCNG